MVESTLDRAAILAGSFVQSLEIHDEVGSTNNRAAEFTRDPSIALPALILARGKLQGVVVVKTPGGRPTAL